MDDLIARMATNPRRIFGLPEQADTWIEVDPDEVWEVRAAELKSRCGWTPFEGWKLNGRVHRIVMRGKTVFQNHQVLALPGSGYNLFD